MERDNYKIRLFTAPLEVVLSAHLNRRGKGEGEGDNGFVMVNVKELG